MSRPTLFIDGEAGTTGLEIRARLAGRDDLDLVSIDPERRKDPEARRRLLNVVDLAVLCLPDAAAREAVALIENPAVRVLDASTAHRVAPGWVYGFPEMTAGQRDALRVASRVANPGCYAIAAVALLRPLTDAGILPPDHPVFIQAAEGYSGGGRAMVDAFEGNGVSREADPYRLYALDLAHKHVPEIQLYGGLARPPLFVPTVGEWRQGMLVAIPLFLDTLPGAPEAERVHTILAAHYAGERFVTVRPLADRPAKLTPEALNGTNRMELFVFDNPERGHALLVARADNLGKGASGAAAQNIDTMLGLEGEREYALGASP
jgi:N-acetyl-gamma-glutamyl-phosphate reductase